MTYKLLRFPEDVAVESADTQKDQKRYFEIKVKRLKTGFDYLKDAIGLGEKEKEKENKTPASTDIKDILKEEELKPNVDSVGETVLGIALPLPNELSESLTHEWSTAESVQGEFLGTLYNGSILGVGIGKAVGQFSNNRARKPVVDPGYFQDYKSTQPRTFSFSWDLVPRSAPEALSIREIISYLKKYSLPSYGINNFTMTAPHHFDIEFGNAYLSSMINMKGLVCTSIQVDYATDGAMQLTNDGMPKIIKLSMSFSERRSLYEGDYTPGGVKE